MDETFCRNGKRNSSDFYMVFGQIHGELNMKFFEVKDLTDENKLLINRENEIKKIRSSYKIMTNTKVVQEFRKLVFLYDERRLNQNQHLTEAHNRILNGFLSKIKVLTFRQVVNPEDISDVDKLQFKGHNQNRYELFVKENEILPILLCKTLSEESLEKDMEYYLRSESTESIKTDERTVNVKFKIFMYLLKMEVIPKSDKNNIKHMIFQRSEEVLKVAERNDDEIVSELSTSFPERSKKRGPKSCKLHTIRKLFIVQNENQIFPLEIEVILNNNKILYYNSTKVQSKLDLSYNLSEYDINNNKVEGPNVPEIVHNEDESKSEILKPSMTNDSVKDDDIVSELKTLSLNDVKEPSKLPEEKRKLSAISETKTRLPIKPRVRGYPGKAKDTSKIPILTTIRDKIIKTETRIPKITRKPSVNRPRLISKSIEPRGMDHANYKCLEKNQLQPKVQTNQPKPKEVIEVKLVAKDFFGEGFKDIFVKEMNKFVTTLIETKKPTVRRNDPHLLNSQYRPSCAIPKPLTLARKINDSHVISSRQIPQTLRTMKPQSNKTLSTLFSTESSLMGHRNFSNILSKESYQGSNKFMLANSSNQLFKDNKPKLTNKDLLASSKPITKNNDVSVNRIRTSSNLIRHSGPSGTSSLVSRSRNLSTINSRIRTSTQLSTNLKKEKSTEKVPVKIKSRLTGVNKNKLPIDKTNLDTPGEKKLSDSKAKLSNQKQQSGSQVDLNQIENQVHTHEHNYQGEVLMKIDKGSSSKDNNIDPVDTINKKKRSFNSFKTKLSKLILPNRRDKK